MFFFAVVWLEALVGWESSQSVDQLNVIMVQSITNQVCLMTRDDKENMVSIVSFFSESHNIQVVLNIFLKYSLLNLSYGPIFYETYSFHNAVHFREKVKECF